MTYSDSYDNNTNDELPQRRGRFKILPLVLFAVIGTIYYFSHQEVVPITGRKQLVDMSQSDELALGFQSYRQILRESEVVRGGKEVDLVRSVGERIAKVVEGSGFEWEFNVLNSSEINAFCLPGGKVAVYTGILPVVSNPDGLAVVMGHEIAHAVARHGAERIAQERLAQMGQFALGMSISDMDEGKRRSIMGAFGIGTQFGVLLPFSRHHEAEADHIGLILMARACFDPNEAPKFWVRMEQAAERGGQPPEFMSTHPSTENRISELKALIPEALEERSKFCS